MEVIHCWSLVVRIIVDCTGDHCRNEIKICYKAEIKTFISAIANNDALSAEFLMDLESPGIEFGNDGQISSNLTSMFGDSTDGKSDAFSEILAKYQLRPSDQISRTNSVILNTTVDPADPEKRQIVVHGFEVASVLETTVDSEVLELVAKDIFFPPGCNRHCLMFNLGALQAGVALAEHRVGNWTSEK